MQYQLLPDLTEDEYAALRDDIAARGVLVAVELDESGAVLDGHHRLRACAELGVTDYPRIIRSGWSELEKRIHIRKLNLCRRHLNQEQKRAVIADILRDQPERSDRSVAEEVQVSPTTVGAVRVETQAGVQSGHLDRVQGRDGKSYPARRAAVIASTEAEERQAVGLFEKGVAPPDDVAVATVQQLRAAERQPWQNIHLSCSNEWYTPQKYVASARAVMGGIDVDPASNDRANEVVKAAVYYTAEIDGLAASWPGRVWLNPPWGGLQEKFVGRLVEQAQMGIVTEAVLLVNAHSTDTAWFQPLWDHTLCFTDHRINYYGTAGSGSTHGSVFVYIGPNWQRFAQEFSQHGAVVRRVII